MDSEITYISYDIIDAGVFPDLGAPKKPTSGSMERNDEILLDASEKPLALAVNSNTPVSFHLHRNSDKKSDLLRTLDSQHLTPRLHKKLMEQFNFENGDKVTKTSSFKATSISSNDMCNGSLTNSIDRSSINGNTKSKKIDRKESQNFSFGMKPKLKKTRKIQSAENKSKRAQNNSSNIDRRGRDSKKSSAARKIFSSIRKTARARSGSRERKNSASSVSYTSDNENELSSDVTLPGILKIFGDAVSPGSNYKSVLATQQSNAQELVKAALERYGVSRSQGKKFVLCEIVGRLKNDDKLSNGSLNGQSYEKMDFSRINNFVEDYVRPLNDHEKPLILQSYWKPLDGYARRFEIRRKSKVEAIIEKDTETHDVNAQAKRLIIQKSRLTNASSMHDISTTRRTSSSSESEEENKVYERKVETKDEQDNGSTQGSVTHVPSPEPFADSGKEKDETPWPYLLTLQGDTGIRGKPGEVIHKLSTRPLTIGGVETSKSHLIDVLLSENFTAKSHCVIHCERRESPTRLMDVSKYYSEWKINLEVIGDSCAVNVNGETVNNSIELNGGNIISIEDHFIFMLKDPTCDGKLTNSVRFSFGVANPHHRNSAFTPVVTRKRRIMKTEICFEPLYSDQVLDAIFVAAQDIVSAKNELYCETSNTEKELSPAKLTCLCIEHACLNFHEEEKREFLLKIASKLQNVVLEATGAVSELQSSDKIKDPDEGITFLLPYLKPVVFWMSNSLEIFSFLQTDLEDLIQARVLLERDGNEEEIKDLLDSASSFQVSEDILAVLEEVVMYSFQQLVYYLTKTLYGALPSLLDSNPFSDARDDDSLLSRDGSSRIIQIYEAAKGLTRSFGVHKDIENQLFAYLFFFTSVSLFNTLMGEESAPVYYRWEKGVQIRGNLEEIEMWASDHGFQEQSAMFLQKFSTLASLLATPRSQMLKSSWSNFRRDFKQLHPSQLRQVLERYHLPSSKPRPPTWMPDAGDLEESTEEQFVMESYDNHPPLVLPTDGIQLDIKLIPEEDWFVSLQEFVVAVGTGRSLNTISNSDSAYQSMNRYGTIEGKKNKNGEYRRSTSDESSQASLTESEINNNTIIREKVNYPSYDDNDDSLLSSTSVSSITSSRSKPTNSNITVTPVPTPRKTATPVPSPRISSRSSDTDKKRSISNPSSDDFTIQGFHSPDRNVAQILLNSDSSYTEKSKKGGKSKKRSPSKKSNGSPEKENMKVLPLQNTEVKHSETKSNEQFTDTDSSVSQCSHDELEVTTNELTPNEVFVVDVVKGSDGLGLGLVDGMFTSLKVNGVFVRSLVPDGPEIKHLHMKHQEVIRCWLQDGRLNLGDRILAVNGKSLLTTNYRTAMRILRQSGDKMRFLVGRCGPDIAMKITSSSC